MNSIGSRRVRRCRSERWTSKTSERRSSQPNSGLTKELSSSQFQLAFESWIHDCHCFISNGIVCNVYLRLWFLRMCQTSNLFSPASTSLLVNTSFKQSSIPSKRFIEIKHKIG